MSLRKWTSEKWVDIANRKKVVAFLLVEDQKVRKERTILSVFHYQKQDP